MPIRLVDQLSNKSVSDTQQKSVFRLIFSLNTNRVSNLLHSNFDIRTIEVGLSSPPFQRAGSTREQGLHAKDSKMQNKAEQREYGCQKRGFNKDKTNARGKRNQVFEILSH